MQHFADMALPPVMNDELKFYPPKYKNTYRNWLENIKDWCISRQLWWGHRIPAYFMPKGGFVVAETIDKAVELARQKSGDNSLTAADLCQDEDVLCWLEKHLVMIPMEPRRPGCSVVEGKDITEAKVKALAKAADDCWQAVMDKDLTAFARAYRDSFDAQTAMFPAMIQGCVQGYIEAYKDKVLAWKMPGAGGGGYLACVVENVEQFVQAHAEAIRLTIRRSDS